MLERGVEVDHSTLNRWVLKYATELDKRIRPHLKQTNDSWRVDETYIKVKGLGSSSRSPYYPPFRNRACCRVGSQRVTILALFQQPPSKLRMTVSVSRSFPVIFNAKGLCRHNVHTEFCDDIQGKPLAFCGGVQPSFSSSLVVLIFPFAPSLKVCGCGGLQSCPLSHKVHILGLGVVTCNTNR